MELRTIIGCYELEDKLGENKEQTFKLIIPANFSWETLQTALANLTRGAQDWEAMNKKVKEEAPAEEAASVQEAVEVEEVVPAKKATKAAAVVADEEDEFCDEEVVPEVN